MDWEAVTPAWVKPTAQQVDDYHWLAYRSAHDTGREWVAAAAATCAWIRGGRNAPVTERDERPVDEATARAEMWAATSVGPDGRNLPLGDVYARLHVAPMPVAEDVTENWAAGVRVTLRWLLGVDDQAPAERSCPLTIPVRLRDGTTPTADELYEANLIAAGAKRPREPEQRRMLRARCEREARDYARLVALIDETRTGLLSAHRPAPPHVATR